nr:MAG TPA: hypothetical protein [Caudoviricetes sp.]
MSASRVYGSHSKLLFGKSPGGTQSACPPG